MSLALIMMTVGYAQPEIKVEPVKVSAPKEKKSKVRANNGSQSAPIAQGSAPKVTMPGLKLPEANSLDASSFLAAVRNAGKRKSPEGKPIFDKSVEREDIIVACAGYIGWDHQASYAANLLRCTGEARKAMAPIVQRTSPLPEYSRGTLPTLNGFVAGMPNQQSLRVQNLLGQEIKATDAMIAWSKVRSVEQFRAAIAEHLNAGGTAAAEAEAKLAMIEATKAEPLAALVMAAAEFSMVERERLDQIRKDLRSMGA